MGESITIEITDLLKEFKKENKEGHDEISNHLKELNGKVADHAKWITQAKVYIKVMSFVMASILLPILIGVVWEYVKRALFN